MGSDWEIRSIASFIDFNPKRVIKKSTNAPYVEMAAVSALSREITYISDKEYKGGACRFQNNDVLFSRITPCLQNGKTAKVSILKDKEIGHGSTEFIVFSAKNLSDNDFIYYLARSPEFRKFAESQMEGTTGRQRVSWQSLANYEALLPNIEHRKRIGFFLSVLDDKIELNRQMNATLEAMAQALFKSWFVDFDPVIDNALAAGNDIPEAFAERAEQRLTTQGSTNDGDVHLGRDQADNGLQSQFPSEFEWTAKMGWIPKEWKVRQIKDVAKVIKGKSYKSIELSESNTALVTLKSFKRGGGYRLDGLKEYIGSYKDEQEVFAGDLVVAYTDVTQAADVIGKPAMVISDSRYSHLVISLDVAVVRPHIQNLKYYLYGVAQTDNFQTHTHSHSTGTTVLHLSKNAVPDYYFCFPTENLLTVYEQDVKPKFISINNNIEASRTLTKLRDTLLPKLLSGEVRIADAEKMVEEVGL